MQELRNPRFVWWWLLPKHAANRQKLILRNLQNAISPHKEDHRTSALNFYTPTKNAAGDALRRSLFMAENTGHYKKISRIKKNNRIFALGNHRAVYHTSDILPVCCMNISVSKQQ